MKRFLIELRTDSDGVESVISLVELYDTGTTKRMVVEVENASCKEGYLADYAWNQEKQVLEVQYRKDVKIEDLISQLEDLKQSVKESKDTEVDLGIQITDVDLGLIEHIVTTEP